MKRCCPSLPARVSRPVGVLRSVTYEKPIDHDDATSVGDGLLMVHTLTGGPRRLRLPGGPAVDLVLPPRSTTVLDAATGAVLLGSDPSP